MTKVFAPAKLNLTLHVTGQRADGYHMLDSLVAFVDVGDEVTAEPASETQLSVTGPFGAGVPCDASNLVCKAADLAQFPMTLTLEKHLPPSSGIGGGSADAAATLRAAMALGAETVSAEQSLRLGADVPVCLTSTPMRMQGVGEALSPAPLPQLHLVLVNPKVEVSTPDVFRHLANKENAPMPSVLPEWPDALSCIDWLSTQRNDLQEAAIQTAPDIAAVLVALALSKGVLLTRMSGSGATCFGVYETKELADAAAQELGENNPWWWVKSASTLFN